MVILMTKEKEKKEKERKHVTNRIVKVILKSKSDHALPQDTIDINLHIIYILFLILSKKKQKNI